MLMENRLAGHIVMVYPVDMSETGSMFYQPMRTIAALPGFITARTKREVHLFSKRGSIKI